MGELTNELKDELLNDAPIRDTADLERRWGALMGPCGFDIRSLWLLFLDEQGRSGKVVVPIDDIPVEPDPGLLDGLRHIMSSLVEDHTAASVPMLLARPGPAAMTDGDRRWARALRTAIGPELSPWPIHLATERRIQVFAPDDLL